MTAVRGAMSPAAMAFACALIVGGVAAMSVVITLVAGLFLEDIVNPEKKRKKMLKRIRELKNHAIICGYGRMGRAITEIFRGERQPFVIIEREQAIVDELEAQTTLVIRGDATGEETLDLAGVDLARCLISVASGDAENLFITLTARQMNPTLAIVSRAEDESAVIKLRRAGATRVVRPYRMGAVRMAHAALRPAVVEFMEAGMGDAAELGGVRFEQLTVGSQSEMAGQSLASLGLSQRYGVIIVGILREAGKLDFNPPGKTLLHPGDTLIAMGSDEQLGELRRAL